MTKTKRSTRSFLAALATALLAAPLGAFAAQPGAKNLNVNFTISGTGFFDGTDPATLTITKDVVTGMISLYAGGSQYACPVQSGSTDTHGKLMLTCAVTGVNDTITLIGTLKPKSGKGSGTFSETFLNAKGNYTAAKI